MGYGLCSGIIERDFDKNVDISTIIVEKFQGFVIVRGRHCIGILNEDEEVCQHCISLFTNDTFTTYTKSKSRQYSRKENNSRQDKKFAPSEKETKVKRSHEDETNEIQTDKKAKQDEFLPLDTKMNVDTDQQDIHENDIIDDYENIIDDENVRRNNDNFTCPLQKCNKQFKLFLGKVMRRHLQSAHNIDPENPPDHLKPSLVFPEDLKKCRDLTNGRILYPCGEEGCDYVAKNLTSLRYHTPSHTGEKPWCCPECGKTFKYKRDFILCSKRHKGDLKYKCLHPQCGKAFMTRRKLEYHTVTHTGEKSLQCSQCPFRCNRPDNLNRHVKLTHGMVMKKGQILIETKLRAETSDEKVFDTGLTVPA